MNQTSVIHSTFSIDRNYRQAPARVFAALSDPAIKRQWFAESDGTEVAEFQLDFRVGGREVTVARLPNGMAMRNDTVFHDIVADRRIVLAYTMTIDDRRISASLATFELVAHNGGTRLVFTEQAAFFEHADGPEMRRQGWTQLLAGLGEALERA